MEKWDAYDSKPNKIEGVTLIRGEQAPEGYFHLCSEIIVRHTDGSYLIMQRDNLATMRQLNFIEELT